MEQTPVPRMATVMKGVTVEQTPVHRTATVVQGATVEQTPVHRTATVVQGATVEQTMSAPVFIAGTPQISDNSSTGQT